MQAAVGEALHAAICDGVVRRDQLWVTGKLWNDSHDRVREVRARRAV